MIQRIVVLFFCWLAFSGLSLAQSSPQGEIQLYYQSVQGFDFDSGTPLFSISDEDFQGGGFGFVYNLNSWFGLWSQSTFFGGVEQNEISLKLINQMQGVKLTARDLGPINLFGKGGMGFTRFVFETPTFETVRFGTSFNFGGGIEYVLKEGLLLIVEGTQMSMSLPDISGLPDRDKWDSNLLVTVGIAFQF